MAFIFICAGVSDLGEHRIKNGIVVFGWCAGIILQTYEGGVYGLLYCILCIFGTIIACMPFYFIGGVGAGDIKLFSVLCGLHGFSFACKAGVVFIIFSGICSLYKLIRLHALKGRLEKMYFLFRYGKKAAFNYYFEKKGEEEFIIPLAPVMASAYFFVYIAESFCL